MIRILILEDETPAVRRLEKLLAEINEEFDILAICDSIESSVKWLRENTPPDLILLDIQLADGLSFDIFSQVHIESFVIFTTAYDKYTLKAFELNSIDYLLKPVNPEKLKNSIEKYKRLKNIQPQFDINEIIRTIQNKKDSYKKRFIITIGNTIKSIETNTIAYFYSMEKCTFLCSEEGKNYPVDYSLDNLEEMIDPDIFFRINRQYILSFSCIQKIHLISKSRIKIESLPVPTEELVVSSAKSHKFRMWLDR